MDKSKYTILNPNDIEKKSFEIISAELGNFPMKEEVAPVIKRIVHTTADFEYAHITEFHQDAVSMASEALRSGCDIYCDTRMVEAGVNKQALSSLGCRIYTYIDDPDIKVKAQQLGITRSILGIDKAAENSGTRIFVIGNAPTALVRIGELITGHRISPALVIGVPVGFVGAAESKEFIKSVHVPYIVTNGRKGGSTVAVAIVNALLYMLK
jgi:precorrin-8X/cobalt-precorrin-8 methylmutase